MVGIWEIGWRHEHVPPHFANHPFFCHRGQNVPPFIRSDIKPKTYVTSDNTWHLTKISQHIPTFNNLIEKLNSSFSFSIFPFRISIFISFIFFLQNFSSQFFSSFSNILFYAQQLRLRTSWNPELMRKNRCHSRF